MINLNDISPMHAPTVMNSILSWLVTKATHQALLMYFYAMLEIDLNRLWLQMMTIP